MKYRATEDNYSTSGQKYVMFRAAFYQKSLSMKGISWKRCLYLYWLEFVIDHITVIIIF